MSQFSFSVPTSLRFGVGCFSQSAKLAGHLGNSVLLVTSPTAMSRHGYSQRLIADLRRQRLAVTVFNDLQTNPTTADVDRGATVARDADVDVVICLGGGSVLDCGKAIAAVAMGRHPAADYLYRWVEVDEHKVLPIVAIPTTAGTGSEVNKSAIVTDRDRQYKDGIRSDHLFPRYAVVDPQLTLTVPRDVTAQTGFDAMAHAIESYVSPKAQPITDLLALAAIRNVCDSLEVVLENPENIKARESLALASSTMGFNLASVGTCFPHRADKALCALHPEIPHGQSVALFYVDWIESCYSGNVARFANIAEILDPSTRSLSAERRASALPKIIGGFIERIGLGKSMAEFGVTHHEIPELVDRVVGDLSVNPVPVHQSSLEEVFGRLLTCRD